MNRTDIAVAHEGTMLQMAGHHGKEAACENARGIIDGLMNGMIRLEGREEAAKFAFALADRVAGGLKEDTLWPLPAPVAIEMPPPAPPPKQRPLWLTIVRAVSRCLPW